MRRMASSSGMQVSVTRLRWRLSKSCFLRGRQMPVMRHALVIIMRHQVEHVLLQIRAGAGDEMHLVAANHLGQGQPEFGGAHGAREANHHAAAGVQMGAVGPRGVHERRGVEMPEVFLNEIGNRPAGGFGLCFLIHRWSLKISALPHDTKVCAIANPQIQNGSRRKISCYGADLRRNLKR